MCDVDVIIIRWRRSYRMSLIWNTLQKYLHPKLKSTESTGYYLRHSEFKTSFGVSWTLGCSPHPIGWDFVSRRLLIYLLRLRYLLSTAIDWSFWGMGMGMLMSSYVGSEVIECHPSGIVTGTPYKSIYIRILRVQNRYILFAAFIIQLLLDPRPCQPGRIPASFKTEHGRIHRTSFILYTTRPDLWVTPAHERNSGDHRAVILF